MRSEKEITDLLSTLEAHIGSLDNWSQPALGMLSTWLSNTLIEVNGKWINPDCENQATVVVQHDVIDHSKVASWLERIFASPIFCRSRNQQKFLRYLVEQTLVGNGDRLKGYSIAVEALERPKTFDPNLDAIVRVEATRLRNKLCEYYRTHGVDDELHFHLAKGGYEIHFLQQKSVGLH